MKNLIIAGASNPGSIRLVDAINAKSPTWNLIGLVDDDLNKWGTDFWGYPVLGEIALLQEPKYRDTYTVCSIYGGSISARLKVIEKMSDMGVKFATLIHPMVYTEHVEIKEDCIINEGCMLNYGVKIGNHCILNLGVSIGHETVLEDTVFCSPRVTITGRVRVKYGVTLGVGSVINGDITIGEYAMVGMSAAVFKSVPDRSTVVGNPAQVILQDSTRSRHPL